MLVITSCNIDMWKKGQGVSRKRIKINLEIPKQHFQNEPVVFSGYSSLKAVIEEQKVEGCKEPHLCCDIRISISITPHPGAKLYGGTC